MAGTIAVVKKAKVDKKPWLVKKTPCTPNFNALETAAAGFCGVYVTENLPSETSLVLYTSCSERYSDYLQRMVDKHGAFSRPKLGKTMAWDVALSKSVRTKDNRIWPRFQQLKAFVNKFMMPAFAKHVATGQVKDLPSGTSKEEILCRIKLSVWEADMADKADLKKKKDALEIRKGRVPTVGVKKRGRPAKPQTPLVLEDAVQEDSIPSPEPDIVGVVEVQADPFGLMSKGLQEVTPETAEDVEEDDEENRLEEEGEEDEEEGEVDSITGLPLTQHPLTMPADYDACGFWLAWTELGPFGENVDVFKTPVTPPSHALSLVAPAKVNGHVSASSQALDLACGGAASRATMRASRLTPLTSPSTADSSQGSSTGSESDKQKRLRVAAEANRHEEERNKLLERDVALAEQQTRVRHSLHAIPPGGGPLQQCVYPEFPLSCSR